MCIVHPKFTYRFHPRTASTATSACLGLIPGSKKLHHHERDVPGPITVCTVRNPLDTMASWYAMYTRPQKRPKVPGVSNLSQSFRPQPLHEFAKTFCAGSFVYPPKLEGGRMFYHLPTDVVIVYERLEKELGEFLASLNLPFPPLQRLERTAKKKLRWQDYYEEDPEAEEVVRRRFPLDFEVWERHAT